MTSGQSTTVDCQAVFLSHPLAVRASAQLAEMILLIFPSRASLVHAAPFLLHPSPVSSAAESRSAHGGTAARVRTRPPPHGLSPFFRYTSWLFLHSGPPSTILHPRRFFLARNRMQWAMQWTNLRSPRTNIAFNGFIASKDDSVDWISNIIITQANSRFSQPTLVIKNISVVIKCLDLKFLDYWVMFLLISCIFLY